MFFPHSITLLTIFFDFGHVFLGKNEKRKIGERRQILAQLDGNYVDDPTWNNAVLRVYKMRWFQFWKMEDESGSASSSNVSHAPTEAAVNTYPCRPASPPEKKLERARRRRMRREKQAKVYEIAREKKMLSHGTEEDLGKQLM